MPFESDWYLEEFGAIYKQCFCVCATVWMPEWSSGLCSCGGKQASFESCCEAVFLPCVLFGRDYALLEKELGEKRAGEEGDCLMRVCECDNNGYVAGCLYGSLWGSGILAANVATGSCASSWWYLPSVLACCWLAEFRGCVRTARNIPGGVCGDVASSLFCSCCVLLQQTETLSVPTAAAQIEAAGKHVDPKAAVFQINRM